MSKQQQDVSLLKAEVEHARETLIKSQAKWTNFCRGILELSKMLVRESKSSQKNERRIKEAAEKIAEYDKVLSLNEEDLNEIEKNIVSLETSQPESYDKFTSHYNEDMQEFSQSLSMISHMQQQVVYVNLHFDKLKESFLTSNDDLKVCAILQALKWRMTHSRHGEARKEVVRSYVEKDLLGLKDPHITLIKSLITRKNKKVTDYVVCLTNVIASEGLGISYLIQSSELISLLLEILKTEKADSNLRQNALGTLQKLSLHRSPQTIMIEGGAVEWIAEILKKEAETLSDYTFEYITALLMNLTLRTAGKIRCESADLGIVKILLDHIEHESLQVKTYINGTLYSLLTRPVIKEQAKGYGMEEMIQHMLSNADEQIKKQLMYILAQLESEDAEECLSDNNEDQVDLEEDDGYKTENEEEIDEDIRNAGHAIGEELLQEFAEGEGIPSEYMSPQVNLYKSSVSSSSAARNLPSAMKSRPRIPRTPMSKEIFNLIKKENEVILKNATHIYKNENANKKKNVAEKTVPVKDKPQEESQGNANDIVKEEEKEKEKVEEPNTNVLKKVDELSQSREFEVAFQSRIKIPRTPPKDNKTIKNPLPEANIKKKL